MNPRRRDPELRDRLVAATERLLAEDGLAGLTTRRIARAAGVADGVLYNHFANKDDLLLAGLAARTSTLLAEFRRARPRPGSATVERSLGRLAAALLDLQRALLPLLAGLVGQPELLRRFLARLHEPDLGGADGVLAAVHEHLAEERRLGRLGDGGDPHLVGVLLFAITQLHALATAVRAPDASSRRAASELRPFVRLLAGMLAPERSTRISVMLAVPDAQAAAAWYERALGAARLWDLGSVLALEVDGAPFLLHEPTTGFAAPGAETTARVEVFVADPDALVRRAVEAGADGSDREVRDHEAPWGVHRQGGFRDPFGHVWHVGDATPLARHTGT